MPIEFRCTQCDRLLRTQDDTAGKQARCPDCGAMMLIPRPGMLAARLPEPAPELYSQPAPTPVGPGAPGIENPYQAPFSSFVAGFGPRSGPPWERDQPSLGSFWQTVKLAYINAVEFYTNMRREGGFGPPIGFAVVATMLGAFVYLIVHVPFAVLSGALADPNVGATEMAVGSLCCFAMLPFGVVTFILATAGLHHLMLVLLGGTDFSFETTFRVIAYSVGNAGLLVMVPACGQYLFWIPHLVFSILGLIYCHEASPWKAAGAVLVPPTLCLGFCTVGVAGLFFA
jgi:DNA-directed RNA polymerase subunit RPC12/RpoP